MAIVPSPGLRLATVASCKKILGTLRGLKRSDVLRNSVVEPRVRLYGSSKPCMLNPSLCMALPGKLCKTYEPQQILAHLCKYFRVKSEMPVHTLARL